MNKKLQDERDPAVVKAAATMQHEQFAVIPAYAEARTALMRVQTIDEAKGIRNKAEALRIYALKAKDGELQMAATEIRLRAERRAGELLIEAARDGARADRGHNSKLESSMTTPTLKDIGVTKYESSEWQKIAALAETDFEERLGLWRKLLTVGSGKPLTTKSFLKTAFSSKSNEWLTPPVIIHGAIKVMGEIDLDPCAETPLVRHPFNVPAKEHFNKSENGLRGEWNGRVYMNPPYGDLVGSFVDCLLQEWADECVTEAIVLVAARTDTTWFNKLSTTAIWCAIRGRLTFVGSGNQAPFPSAVFYLGKQPDRFAQVFGELGTIYRVY